MSKKNQLRNLTAGGVVLLLFSVLLTAGAGVCAAQQAKPASINPKTTAIREATAEVLRETSEIRKLPILRPVRSGAQTRAEIEQMLVRNLNENSTPEELHASETGLKKYGLVPASFQLRPFIIKLLVEQVAGYYDPKTQQFYLADWIDLDGQKPVMAHELTHALQDQHFNLRRFEKWPKHDSDAELAAQSLVEGDATVLMFQYVTRSPMRQVELLKSLLKSGNTSMEQIDNAPRVLRETLLFPYTQGSAWVMQVYKRGGWEQVSLAYRDLPKSTEQIMHPEKYFAHEAPLNTSNWKNISNALGKGWKVADNDVNGEWSYYLILDEYLNSKEESQKAAAGWNGDRYVLYTGPNTGDALITQKTFWDTETDAREFYDAYTKRTTKRYGTEASEAESGSMRQWKTREGSVMIELDGKSVLIVEGVPENIKAEDLLKML
ncbi:MAG: hypothetical protein LC754_07235 [Acidobacteria bacterium]|nr:hypothetical protein [Acidobacteriota bacterium]